MTRCAKCILPDTTPGIYFDEKGVCNYCRDYRKLEFKGEEELLKVLDSHRRPDSKYDCIVNLSGGRDSTYTLLKLVKDYGMKVLAVNYQNPFTDPVATANIKNATGMLGVDLVSFKMKKGAHERMFRNNIRTWFRKPSPGLIPMMCVGCKTIWWDILKIARRYDIHCIVSGGNRFEDVSYKKVLLGVSANEMAETTFIKEGWGIVKEILKNPGYLHPTCLWFTIKGYLFGNPYTLGSRLMGHHLDRIDLFFYLRWNEEEVISRISSEVGWDYPRRLNSTWRFDCKIGHLKDYMYTRTIGMTEKDDFYAKMVREGVMTREEALERLNRENILHLEEIRGFLKEQGLEEFLEGNKFS